eukprot:207960-Alexandrium_andersonii.AAC.1
MCIRDSVEDADLADLAEVDLAHRLAVGGAPARACEARAVARAGQRARGQKWPLRIDHLETARHLRRSFAARTNVDLAAIGDAPA